MKRNYTVAFIMLIIASIAGGLAFKNVLDYSMIVGVGLGVIFLLSAAFFAGKSQSHSRTQ